MRAFIGIAVDPASAHALAQASAVGRASRLHVLHDARWVPPENLHLTLRFLGDVDPSRAAGMREALDTELRILGRFDLPILDAVIPMRPAGRASMLWCLLGDPHDECTALVARMSSALARLGIPPETRPFTPHVTLARLKRPSSIPPDVIELMNARVASAFDTDGPSVSVQTVTLFSSTLTRKGAVYEKVWELPLDPR